MESLTSVFPRVTGRLRIVDSQHPQGQEEHQVLSAPVSTQRLRPVRSGAVIPEPVYACPKCKDKGFRRVDVPVGDPQFGKAFPCVCKIKEQKQRQKSRLLAESRILTMKRYRNATFENFDLTPKGVKDAYQRAFRYATKPNGWLVFSGGVGCGKTYLSVCIGRERVEEEAERVYFEVVPDLLDQLRAGFKTKDDEMRFETRFALLKEVELLILDDLGAENLSPWAIEKVLQLLNYRYNEELPTVITMNYLRIVERNTVRFVHAKSGKELDERVASRLSDGGLVRFIDMSACEDYRPRNQFTEED